MEYGLWGILGAGVLTAFTPCVLPLIPIYLSLLLGSPLRPQDSISLGGRLRLLVNALLFSVGFILVFSLLGFSATALGSLLIKHKIYFSLFGGLLIFLFGLKFFGWLTIPWLEREVRLDGHRLETRFTSLNALIMGLVFAFGWTPCVGPVLGGVLTYTASQTSNLWEGAGYLALYGLGFSVPLLALAALATTAPLVTRAISRHLPRLERVTGLLLVGAGIYLMASAAAVPEAEGTPTGLSQGGDQGAQPQPPLGSPTKEPRVVEFLTPSCNICRTMIPTVNALQGECGKRGVEILKVDISTAESMALARKYSVRGVPTFVFLDEGGREVARLIGYQTVQSLQQAIAALVGDNRCSGIALLPHEEPTREGKTCEGEEICQ